MNIKEEKSFLRKTTIDKLKRQTTKERVAKSAAIAEKILVSRDYLEGQTIMFYAAMIYEVETKELILDALKRKKTVVLPAMKRNTNNIILCHIKDLEEDTNLCEYGFLEPKNSIWGNVEAKDIDVVYIPGICFDERNNRLGRGAAYYDKFLSSLRSDTKKIGIAFDLQLVDHVPAEAHDIVLDYVVTN